MAKLDENRRLLAEARCLVCAPVDSTAPKHLDCGGTGRRFSDLSRVCPCITDMERDCGVCGFVKDVSEPSGWRFIHDVDCEECNGTGRIPIPTDGIAVLQAAPKECLRFILEQLWNALEADEEPNEAIYAAAVEAALGEVRDETHT